MTLNVKLYFPQFLVKINCVVVTLNKSMSGERFPKRDSKNQIQRLSCQPVNFKQFHCVNTISLNLKKSSLDETIIVVFLTQSFLIELRNYSNQVFHTSAFNGCYYIRFTCRIRGKLDSITNLRFLIIVISDVVHG